MATDTERIDDCALALLLLGRQDGQHVWKSFDWDAMGRLHKKGLISDPVGRAIRSFDKRSAGKGGATVSRFV
jgi:hypothetical protein